MPGLLPVALRSGLLVIFFSVLHYAQRNSRTHHPLSRKSWSILADAAWMAALPVVAAARAGAQLSPLTEALVFALTPVFVVFFVAQSTPDFGLNESPLRLLAPALAGVGGAALLLPFALPSSAAGQVWLGLLTLTAAGSAWGAMRLHRRLLEVPLLSAAAIFSASIFLLATAFCLARAAQFSSWSAAALAVEVARSLLFDGPVTLLTVWLLREASPVAFSSRYFFAIAVTITEGYILLRPETNWTTDLGLLLLLASGSWLFVAEVREVS